MHEYWSEPTPRSLQVEAVVDQFLGKAPNDFSSNPEAHIPKTDLIQLTGQLHLSDRQAAAFEYLARNKAQDIKEELDWDVFDFEQGGSDE